MILQKTERLMKKMLEDSTFDSCAILVCKDGDEMFLASPNADRDTYFDIASMGKVLVTSTLLLQAIDRGLLKFEDTLEKFFDGVPEEKRNITIKQLMTHTSGIRYSRITEENAAKGHDAVAEFLLNPPLLFMPGTNFHYSDCGFVLLGFILEQIYHQRLDQIYYKNIAEPLGMTRTRFNIAIDEPNAAICYRRKEVGKLRADDENNYALGGICGLGGEYSCVNDIQKHIQAVLRRDNRLYSDALYDAAEINYTPDYSAGRGLGYLMVDEKNTQTGKLFPIGSFGHCGHTGGSFFISREMNMYAIVMTNATRFLNVKNNFNGYSYNDVMKMREVIHNTIAEDLFG